jgi:hypothetical protein
MKCLLLHDMHDSKSHLLYEWLMRMYSFEKIIGSVMHVVVH